MSNQGEMKYHDQDKAAAIARAKELGGQAIRSIKPGVSDVRKARQDDWGYYSEGPGHSQMIRTWETLVWPCTDDQA